MRYVLHLLLPMPLHAVRALQAMPGQATGAALRCAALLNACFGASSGGSTGQQDARPAQAQVQAQAQHASSEAL